MSPYYSGSNNTTNRSNTPYYSGLNNTQNSNTQNITFNPTTNHMDFRFKSEFDTMGRAVTSIWPDSDGIGYGYNQRGLLNSIPGFLNNIVYNPAGQFETVYYNNRVRTQYNYDNRLRLKHLRSEFEPGVPLQDLDYTYDRVSNITKITDGRTIPVADPGDPLRFRNTGLNTQSYIYDDLNRLTQSSGLAYGTIDFQYDKIGNMVYKQSPGVGDVNHVDDPLINLGTMSYGGSAGANSRVGRQKGENPGPHAITSTQFGHVVGNTNTGFTYDYDDNGNMTRHAMGDIYNWDNFDRLARVQKDDTTSDFIYDHAGQRVIKKETKADQTKISVYVSNNFEIRDGKIYKFVFAGNKRIARIEGPDGASQENDNSQDGDPNPESETAQTLNFQPGYNFFSFQVVPNSKEIATLLAPIADKVVQVLTYDTEYNVYWRYAPQQGMQEFATLEAGKGYIIEVSESTSLNITGPKQKDPVALQPGWNLVPSHVADVIPMDQAFAILKGESNHLVWGYSANQSEGVSFTAAGDRPEFLNDLKWSEPGAAYWVHVAKPVTLPFLDQKTRNVRYFHPDHLGSTSLTTDEKGAILSETAYYPFGRPRYQQTADGKGSFYKYTGKELDQTGLFYYEARYMDPVIGRFITVDPLLVETPKKCGIQECNLYSYTKNNPINSIDTDGLLTIVVHGTFAKGAAWAKPTGKFSKAVAKTFNEKTVYFEWSGDNNKKARTKGAERLHDLISSYEFSEGEKLNIVAHSHGGNVVKEYTNIKGSSIIDTMVNFATPQRKDYRIDPLKVGFYVNVYSKFDFVQGHLGGQLASLGNAGRTDEDAHKNISADKFIQPNPFHRIEVHSKMRMKKAWDGIKPHLGDFSDP